jgi:hypothetical protein
MIFDRSYPQLISAFIFNISMISETKVISRRQSGGLLDAHTLKGDRF